MAVTDRDDAAPRGRVVGSSPGGGRLASLHGQPYQLGELLRQGRVGAVHRARREQDLQGVVVWHRPLGSSAESARELEFLRRACRRSGVRHPNLIKVLDYGTEGDEGFLVTEPPPRTTLEGLTSQGPLDPDFVVHVASGVAAGLACLHEAGFAHGAVSPAVVGVVIDEGGRPHAVLCDDGLAVADPAAVNRDLEELGGLLCAALPVVPIVLDGVVGRLTSDARGARPTAEDAARELRAHLVATPVSVPRRAAVPMETQGLSGTWWRVLGSVAIALLSLVAVGAGAVGITESLFAGSAPSSPGPGVRVFDAPRIVDVVDGVPFTPEEARRTLRFVNEASLVELRGAGVHATVATRILDARPFVSLEALGETPGIGPKSVATLRAAAR